MERIQAAIEKARAMREGTAPASPDATAPDAAPPAGPVPPADPPARATGPLHEAVQTPPARPPAPRPPGSNPASNPSADPAARPHSAPRAPRFHLSDVRSVWQDLRAFKPDAGLMRRHRIVSYERTDETHIAYDMMRTRLLQHMRANGWTSCAITSPGANCGKTTTCLNLAFALAYQQDTRTVVMDMDLRRPQMGKMLGLKEVHSMARILDGSGQVSENFVRYGETLAIGTNERAARHPSELLQHRAAAQALADLRAQLTPDVILYDMPPMMSNDDVIAFLPHVDCVLLVAAAEATTIDEVDRCERELGAQTNVLGVVLNKCRYTTERYGYY